MREWSFKSPEGKDIYMHLLSLILPIISMDDQIFRESRGYNCGHTLICGFKAAWLLASQPQCVAASAKQSSNDPAYLGTLSRWELRRSLEIPANEIHLLALDPKHHQKMRVTDLPEDPFPENKDIAPNSSEGMLLIDSLPPHRVRIRECTIFTDNDYRGIPAKIVHIVLDNPAVEVMIRNTVSCPSND